MNGVRDFNGSTGTEALETMLTEIRVSVINMTKGLKLAISVVTREWLDGWMDK